MDIQKIKSDLLNPTEYNPRKDLKPSDKEYEKLKRSITEFGFVEPVVWNKQTGHVVGGHQRLKVMLELGNTEIDCVVVDLDLPKEKALNVALNKIQGDWDTDKLAALIADLDANDFDVSLTGFDAAEVDELMDKFYSKTAVQDDFDADKAKSDIAAKGTTTQKGDIWLLGNHRLMCGDSTSEADFQKLMDGKHAQMAVTSPPYGVGKEYEERGIEPWLETIRPAIKNITKFADVICWQMIDLYCTGTQFIEPTGLYSVQMFADSGFRPIWIRIWNKQRQALSTSTPYHLATNKPVNQYEYISAFAGQEVDQYADQEYAWLSAFAGHSYKFVKRLSKEERKLWGYSGIWNITCVNAHKDHPAMFPVELPWRCIKMHSDKGGIVLEPFSGSGTTIIAAEQTERHCYAMELSEIYCDLAVRRWQEFTGETAVKLEV